MVHSVQRLVESMTAQGSCPRLQVDLTCEGVVCPDFICKQWKEQLVVDLDPSYPLNLSFTAEGLEADLAFDGFVTRCVFPYRSIYVVADRASGKGVVFDENLPESVRRKRQAKFQLERGKAKPARPSRASGESRRRRRPRPQPQLVAAADPSPDQLPDPSPDPSPDQRPQTDRTPGHEPGPTPNVADEDGADQAASTARDEAAERRRSVFRVIDGGK